MSGTQCGQGNVDGKLVCTEILISIIFMAGLLRTRYDGSMGLGLAGMFRASMTSMEKSTVIDTVVVIIDGK
jgi:hypothetical protein